MALRLVRWVSGAVLLAAAPVASQGSSPCLAGEVPWPLEQGKEGYHCQDAKEAADNATAFLLRNMPPWDVLQYGKITVGVIGPTVTLSLAARQTHDWAAAVPQDIWQDWVLPYASVDESRSDWREFLAKQLKPLVDNATNLSQAALILNENLWTVLRPQGQVVFKSEQSPMIYDPMSTLVFGYASCTGISILFVDALRSVGIPARLAGTPAWHNVPSDGNHNWVEIWVGVGSEGGDGWAFIEGKPAGGGETLTNPCDKWFCNQKHFGDGQTQVFAARFDRHSNTSIYPMAWDLQNQHVPGVNRTAYYHAACAQCGVSSSLRIVEPTLVV
ncbi:unnamed protein product [Polarella glacialis]|uniref:Transglutaminase-like domain-containing protein n=1 Tax=Polarella glacialis TaxID=89957 RepID=A0A813F2U4_POLGL|nr:unnamed protein product [Polarella glacialis]